MPADGALTGKVVGHPAPVFVGQSSSVEYATDCQRVGRAVARGLLWVGVSEVECACCKGAELMWVRTWRSCSSSANVDAQSCDNGGRNLECPVAQGRSRVGELESVEPLVGG